MATRRWLTTLLFVPAVFASTMDERALQLNEEMDFLLGSANKPTIWMQGSLPPRAERSGPAPGPAVEGIENLENRFFEDEVRFQAAQAVDTSTTNETNKTDRGPDPEDVEYRVDGSVPSAQ